VVGRILRRLRGILEGLPLVVLIQEPGPPRQQLAGHWHDRSVWGNLNERQNAWRSLRGSLQVLEGQLLSSECGCSAVGVEEHDALGMFADVDRSDFFQPPSRRDDRSLHHLSRLGFVVTALALRAPLGRHVEPSGEEGQAELVADTEFRAEEGSVRLLADVPDLAALHLKLWSHDRVEQLVDERLVDEQRRVKEPLEPSHRTHVGSAHAASPDCE